MPYVFQGIAAFLLLNSLSFVILLDRYINKVIINKVDVNKVGGKLFATLLKNPRRGRGGPSTGGRIYNRCLGEGGNQRAQECKD